MAFIGRNLDGTIYGYWTIKQANDEDHPRLEELPDNHPDVVAFLAPKPIPPNGSNIDNAERKTLAMALAVADVGGLTRAQIKALYKAKYDSLP